MGESAKEALGSAVQSMVNVGIKVSFTKKELDDLGVSMPPVKLSADQIKNIRKKMNLSQSVFAKLLNVSLSSVRQWEQGVRRPSGSTMVLLELLEREPAVLDYRLAS
ncbi:MAG: transcriptional regulator [Sulfurospirillum sp.]|nr:MAG: transcriptional regulator [Sulfurospirillum sp.]